MKLSKELQDTLDQAESSNLKVMQADGTEADLAWDKKKNEIE